MAQREPPLGLPGSDGADDRLQIGGQLPTQRLVAPATQGNRDPNRFGPWYQLLFALVVPISVGVWVFAGPILETLFGSGWKNLCVRS